MEMFTTQFLSSSSFVINDVLHVYLIDIATFFKTILEFMGLIILVYAAFKCFISWLKKDPHTHLNLAEGLAMSLSFKLGGEILRTLVVHDMAEIMQVGAITLLRALITILIHWEIRNEERQMRELAEKNAGKSAEESKE